MIPLLPRPVAIQIPSVARHHVTCEACGFSTDAPDAANHEDAIRQITSRHRCAEPRLVAGSYACEDCGEIVRFCDLVGAAKNGVAITVCKDCRRRIARGTA